MARYTTGEEIPPHLTSPRLPADHPLFKRGFMIGIRRGGATQLPGSAGRSGSSLPNGATPPTSQPQRAMPSEEPQPQNPAPDEES
jgi:hypothetical protein